MIPIQLCVRSAGEEDLSQVGANVDMLTTGVGELVALFESDKRDKR